MTFIASQTVSNVSLSLTNEFINRWGCLVLCMLFSSWEIMHHCLVPQFILPMSNKHYLINRSFWSFCLCLFSFFLCNANVALFQSTENSICLVVVICWLKCEYVWKWQLCHMSTQRWDFTFNSMQTAHIV